MNRNTTDYVFPDGWGLFSDQQKHRWYVRERVFRQACRQDTVFGRRYRSQQRDTDSVSVQQAFSDAESDPYRYK